MSWGELAHLGGNYTLKFLMEKTQLKQNETTTPARFGCPDQQQIYQSPWWKKPRIHPLGAHPNQVEARTLRWWGVSPCLEDTLDHYFSPRIIEDGGLRVKTMRKFRRMYPWMGIWWTGLKLEVGGGVQ